MHMQSSGKNIGFHHMPVLILLCYRVDEGQASLVKAFESSKGKDKGRCILAKELSIKSISTL